MTTTQIIAVALLAIHAIALPYYLDLHTRLRPLAFPMRCSDLRASA